MAARMIIWRHGRTEHNVTGVLQGQASTPLDDAGHRQARSAAHELVRYGPTALYST